MKKHFNKVLLILLDSKISHRHYLMLKTLKKRGWHINVIAWDRQNNDNKYHYYKEIVDEWYWINVQAPTGKLSIITKMPRFFYKLWKIIGILPKPDLLIISHLALLPLAPFISSKMIFDDIEMYIKQIPIYYLGPLANIASSVMSVLVGLVVKQINGVTIVDSKGSWLEKYYKKWNPLVQVIWNLPSALTKASPSIEPSVASWLSDRQVVAYVGGSFRQKGLHAALETCAIVKQKYPQVLFLFIGQLKDDVNEIGKLIKSLSIKDNVYFVKQMSYEDMLAYLNYAQIGLALYQPAMHYELVSAGNGRKIFTYMQAGLPIIAPKFGEISMVVKREECGLLVDTTKPEEISQAILYLLDYPEEAKKMGEKGIQAFLQKYNWEQEEHKFISFLEKVLAD